VLFKEVCIKEKWKIFSQEKKRKPDCAYNRYDKICSLNINHLGSKKLDLEVLLMKEKPMIIGFQETRITERYKPIFGDIRIPFGR
jgi:hypothetical protein